MSKLTPEEAVLRGRLGGLRRSALYDGRDMTAKAREAMRDKFIAEVDPDLKLPEAERLRRAEAARKAHYARLTLMAARARKAKANRRAAAEARTTEMTKGESL